MQATRRGGLRSGPASWDPQAVWEGWAAQRQLDAPRLERVFGLAAEDHGGRPRLAFPTDVGAQRYRYLDGGRPKACWQPGAGGCGHWYGLRQALPLLAGETLWLVNGEVSVWACWQADVPAVCTAVGEEALPRDLEPLRALGAAVRIAYDLDAVGRRGAEKAEAALRLAGIQAAAVELPPWLGPGGDVDDLHRAVGDAGLFEALMRLPAARWARQSDGASSGADSGARAEDADSRAHGPRRGRTGREWAEWGKARARARKAHGRS